MQARPDAPRDYPDPPWPMHGFAWARSYLVPTDALDLPPPLEPVAAGGRTTGLLLYVRYTEPSPLTYHELVWAPALVRAPGGEIGLYVAAIYVDDERSLRGGREIWALPKAMARFEAEGGAERAGEGAGSVRMRADDGTSIDLRMRAFGPSRVYVPQFLATLQTRGGRVERFTGRGSGRAGLASLEVPHFSSEHEGWAGFIEARALPAMRLASFEIGMQPPEVLARRPGDGDAIGEPPA
ncbi:MAG TPA: acetoacetate decarboxylase family protein [Polyangiaceae bacterium]|nr:acetoacetate decarboxylase family protein [Polyangiaceae bacterium]